MFGTGWWPWWVGSEGKLMIADGSWWRPCQRGSDASADKSSSKHLRPLSTKNSSMKSINGKTAHQSTIGRNFIEFKSPVDLIFDLIEFEIWKVWIWRHFFLDGKVGNFRQTWGGGWIFLTWRGKLNSFRLFFFSWKGKFHLLLGGCGPKSIASVQQLLVEL